MNTERPRFLTTLWQGYPATSWVEIRLLPKNRGQGIPTCRFFPMTKPGLGACYRMLDSWESEPRNVFMSVYPRRARGANLVEDVPEVRVLYTEIDGALPPGLATPGTGQVGQFEQPHHLIASGGGYHLYWFLSEPVALRTDSDRLRITNVHRRLIHALGADNCHDVARILRPPGTWNVKYDPPRRVKLDYSELHPRRRTLAWWEDYLPPVPIVTARPAENRVQGCTAIRHIRGTAVRIPLATKRMLNVPAGPSQWNPMCKQAAVALRKAHWSEDQIRTVLLDYTRRSNRLDCGHTDELERLIQWTMRRVNPDPAYLPAYVVDKSTGDRRTSTRQGEPTHTSGRR